MSLPRLAALGGVALLFVSLPACSGSTEPTSNTGGTGGSAGAGGGSGGSSGSGQDAATCAYGGPVAECCQTCLRTECGAALTECQADTQCNAAYEQYLGCDQTADLSLCFSQFAVGTTLGGDAGTDAAAGFSPMASCVLMTCTVCPGPGGL